jgi:hypothetical protein
LVPLLNEALKPARAGEGEGASAAAMASGARHVIEQSLVRQHEGDVVSPSYGRTKDKKVAAWATRGGRESKWLTVAGAPSARWWVVVEPPRRRHVHAGRTRGHGPS